MAHLLGVCRGHHQIVLDDLFHKALRRFLKVARNYAQVLKLIMVLSVAFYLKVDAKMRADPFIMLERAKVVLLGSVS